MYDIRNARMEDLPVIQDIYAYARGFMAKTGNPNQWGQHHPPYPQLEAPARAVVTASLKARCPAL